MKFLTALKQYISNGKLKPEIADLVEKFYHSYHEALQNSGKEVFKYDPVLLDFLNQIVKQIESPYQFEPYHQSITEPFDYYHFGMELFRPMIIFEKSKVNHLKRVDQIVKQLKKGENVVLFANHQTEPDPQIISLLLENSYPELAKNMIFIAGHRVISDPLAVPFSLGRNLLCIYSKNHVENPPEQKQEKLLHNKKTMKKMSELLAEGSKCIYVAPSGGRDRPNAEGIVEVAPFDPQSIEMFWLMAQHSGHPTHFYPFAMATYNLLPPPNSIEKELGEKRHTRCTPVSISFGSQIDMLNFPGYDPKDKWKNRAKRAEYIWKQVTKEYQDLQSDS